MIPKPVTRSPGSIPRMRLTAAAAGGVRAAFNCARLDDHGGARGRDHQHRAALTDRLVVEVDADPRVGAQFRRRLAHFGERGLAGAGEDVLVRARASADDVAHRREEVADDVGADDGLAGDDAQVPGDPPAFERGRGGEEHGSLPVAVAGRGRRQASSMTAEV
jgi:hypothetical protein